MAHRSAQMTPTGRLGFNGALTEANTGWQLLGNGYRAYNPVLMRFHSPDSLSPFGDCGLNAYAYCQGDPVNFLDPTGHFKLWGLGKLFKARPPKAPEVIKSQIEKKRIFEVNAREIYQGRIDVLKQIPDASRRKIHWLEGRVKVYSHRLNKTAQASSALTANEFKDNALKSVIANIDITLSGYDKKIPRFYAFVEKTQQMKNRLKIPYQSLAEVRTGGEYQPPVWSGKKIPADPERFNYRGGY